jgi:hypothetical protein
LRKEFQWGTKAGRQALCCCVPTPVDKEVHEVEDLLRGPSELGHAALDPDELNLRTQMGGGRERQRGPAAQPGSELGRCSLPRARAGRAGLGWIWQQSATSSFQIKHRQLRKKRKFWGGGGGGGGGASLCRAVPCPAPPRQAREGGGGERERTSATAETRAYAAAREKKAACCQSGDSLTSSHQPRRAAAAALAAEADEEEEALAAAAKEEASSLISFEGRATEVGGGGGAAAGTGLLLFSQSPLPSTASVCERKEQGGEGREATRGVGPPVSVRFGRVRFGRVVARPAGWGPVAVRFPILYYIMQINK